MSQGKRRKPQKQNATSPFLKGAFVLVGVFLIVSACITGMRAITQLSPKEAPVPPIVQPQSTVDTTAWNLLLVNSTHAIPDGYSPELSVVDQRGAKFDVRAADALKEMLSAAESAGLSPIICSSYRSSEKQTQIFDRQVASLREDGLSQAEALEKAKTFTAYPGTSEHQLGLSADIVSLEYQNLDEKQAETPEQLWLMKHCAEFGFILRYPTGKSEITGVIFEPWHYRYVGSEAAQEIMSRGITLEEYLSDFGG
ncbi:MAG: M15 family metallopeptidase [Evtepia sp.]